MLEVIITIAIVAVAAVFVGMKYLRPLWRKEPSGHACDFCASPCASKNLLGDPNLCCQVKPIRELRPQNKSDQKISDKHA
jgi:hypothetical protein